MLIWWIAESNLLYRINARVGSSILPRDSQPLFLALCGAVDPCTTFVFCVCGVCRRRLRLKPTFRNFHHTSVLSCCLCSYSCAQRPKKTSCEGITRRRNRCHVPQIWLDGLSKTEKAYYAHEYRLELVRSLPWASCVGSRRVPDGAWQLTSRQGK